MSITTIKQYKSHPVIIHIAQYCKLHNIKFIVTRGYNDNYFHQVKRELKLSIPPTKIDDDMLSYLLFIASHEYGHAFQNVDCINVTDMNDNESYIRMIHGIKVSKTIQNRITKGCLSQEHTATEIGLKLLKKLGYYPNRYVLKDIKYKSNLQLLAYYCTFKYCINIWNYDIGRFLPNKFLNPHDLEFSCLAQDIHHRFIVGALNEHK